MITPERIAELSQVLVDYNAATFAIDRKPFSIDSVELAELSALAAAGVDNLVRFTENVAKLSPKPGDLLVVRADAPDDSTYAALQAGLSAVARSFGIRVLAISPDATIEEVSADRLAAFADRIEGRSRAAFDRYGAEGVARMVSEAAGECGLELRQVRRN